MCKKVKVGVLKWLVSARIGGWLRELGCLTAKDGKGGAKNAGLSVKDECK